MALWCQNLLPSLLEIWWVCLDETFMRGIALVSMTAFTVASHSSLIARDAHCEKSRSEEAVRSHNQPYSAFIFLKTS